VVPGVDPEIIVSGLGIWRISRRLAARAARPAAEMNSQSGGRQQHLRREPPRVAGVTAEVSIDRVVEDMQCPSHKEASEGGYQRIRRQQTQQQCGAYPDLEGSGVVDQVLVVRRERDPAGDPGAISAHDPTASMDAAQIRTTDLTNIRLARPTCRCRWCVRLRFASSVGIAPPLTRLGPV